MAHDIFDTSVISEFMSKAPSATEAVHQYFHLYGFIPVSSITLYEIRRGINSVSDEMTRKRLTRDWDRIEELLSVYNVNSDVAIHGATIWSKLGRQRAEQIGDADILIGATARAMNKGVYTINTKDFIEMDKLIVHTISTTKQLSFEEEK